MSTDLLPVKAGDVSRAVTDFRELIHFLIETLQDPIGIGAIAIILLLIIFRKAGPHAFNYVTKRKQWKADLMDSYLSKNTAAIPTISSVLIDTRDTYYFRVATGIYAEKNRRDPLISLHSSLKEIGSWQLIRRAGPFLQMNSQGEIYVPKFKPIDQIGFGFNVAMFLFFAVMFAAGVSTLVFLRPKDGAVVQTLLLGIIGAAILFIYAAAQNWPYYAAKRIREKLRETTSS